MMNSGDLAGQQHLGQPEQGGVRIGSATDLMKAEMVS